MQDQELSAAGLKLYRKRSAGADLGHVLTPASGRGFLLGVALKAGHRHRIL